MRFRFQPVRDLALSGPQRPTGLSRNVLELAGAEVLYFEATRQLWLLYPGLAQALCQLDSGDVIVSYRDSAIEAETLVCHPLFTIPLAELLKQHGLFLAHAAGLCWKGQGLLVAGASGSGKTTLSLALLRAGFEFLADDTVMLSHLGGELRVLAFPDEVDVTGQTARFFPELHELASRSSTDCRPKRSFSAAQVYGISPCWSCPPRVLLFPRPAHRPESAVTPMSKDCALLELICNVVRTEAVASQAHLDVLAELVRRCACFSLETGDDFVALPALVRSLLNRVNNARDETSIH